jgi:hypothetical protein
MNHRRPLRIRPILVSLLLLVVAGWVSASTAPASAPVTVEAVSARNALACGDLPRLMATYLQNHVLYRSVTDELRERTAESHLRMLDSSRSLFLEKEAA